MADRPIIPRQSVGKTFGAAMWCLGVLAMVQVVAAGLAIVRRVDFSPSPKAGAANLVTSPAGVSGVDGAGDLAAIAPPSQDSSVAPGERPIPPPPDPAQSWPDFRRDLEIQNPEVIELMDAAESLRQRGDLQGTLARLREADNLLPDHPRILYGLADCFRTLGLQEKAALEWEKILAMGRDRAGHFWEIADLNRRGQMPAVEMPDGAVLKVSNIFVQRHPEIASGEKVTLRVALKARSGAAIIPTDVVVNVFFFDSVDGTSVARTTANEPRYRWNTPPIDWKGQPEEILDVEYFQPVLEPQQLPMELGERRYYGYIVEVYYQDELQDVVAQPRTLRGMGLESTNPLFNNRLFPGN